MKTTQYIIIALIAGFALLTLPLSAQEPGVPDFSKGIPDVNLEKKGKANGTEHFHLTTALSHKEFFTNLETAPERQSGSRRHCLHAPEAPSC